MDAMRQTIRWSTGGAICLLATMLFCSMPSMIQEIGTGVTPLPNLYKITPADIALLVFATPPVGFLVYQLAHFLPAMVLPTGIVRFDLSGQVLADPRVTPYAQRLCAGVMEIKHYPTSFGRLTKRWTGNFSVFRLDVVTGWRVPREVRVGWRKQLDDNRSVLAALGSRLVGPAAAEMRSEYQSLTDLYRGIGATRVGVLLAAVMGLLRIGLYSAGYSVAVKLVAAAVVLLLSVFVAYVVLTRQREQLLDRRLNHLRLLLPELLDSHDRESRRSGRPAGGPPRAVRHELNERDYRGRPNSTP